MNIGTFDWLCTHLLVLFINIMYAVSFITFIETPSFDARSVLNIESLNLLLLSTIVLHHQARMEYSIWSFGLEGFAFMRFDSLKALSTCLHQWISFYNTKKIEKHIIDCFIFVFWYYYLVVGSQKTFYMLAN